MAVEAGRGCTLTGVSRDIYSPRTQRIDLPWGRLCVYLTGSGPPLLALHGLGGSGRYWHGFAAALGGRFTVVAPDLAGFGASDKPDAPYDRGFHLDALDGMVAALGLGWPRLVAGHSMGGVLGALWTARHLPRVAALALVASPFPTYRAPRPPERPHSPRSVAHRVLRTLWPVITLPYRSRVYPRAVVRDYARHTSISYWRTAYSLIWDPALVDSLTRLRTGPGASLLLYARDDPVLSPSAQRDWRRILPRAESRIVETGGHQLLLKSGFVPLAGWLLGHGQPA